MSFIVREKEWEDFRWRSGIGRSGNRKSIEMYIFGHVMHGHRNY